MDLNGFAALIVALTGLASFVVGTLLTRRGRRETQRQKAAADQALADKTRLAETQQALDATRKRAETAEAGEERWRVRADELEVEVDQERDRRRTTLADQEARCQRTVAQLHDVVETLRGVVVDEISRAAAGLQVAAVRAHPHDPLPELDCGTDTDDHH